MFCLDPKQQTCLQVALTLNESEEHAKCHPACGRLEEDSCLTLKAKNMTVFNTAAL